ncbi:MAG: GspMb/PilO family protein [Chthoniobacteraceae bacterium]
MNRLTSRERTLIYALSAVLFLLVNWGLIGWIARQYSQLQASCRAKQIELRSLQTVIADEPTFAAREQWLASTQPKSASPEQAGVQLLDQIKNAAKDNQIRLENPELGTLETVQSNRSVSVQLTAKSSWAGLVKFLHTLQTPENFIVIDSATLQVDPGNAKQMTCQLKISKWYAL